MLPRSLHACVLVASALLLATSGRAAAQPWPVGYVHRQWTARDGLPVDGLTDLIQTRDGYLWIGTWDGLVRFDGVRFVTFHMGNTDALPSNRITRIVELPDGRLRVRTSVPTAVIERTERGFVRLTGPADSLAPPHPADTRTIDGWSIDTVGVARDGREVFRAASRIRRHIVDREGNLWLATLNTGLYQLRRAEVTVVELPGDAARRRTQSVREDAAGRIWIGTPSGDVYRWENGRLTLTSTTHSLAWLGRDAAGRMWVAADVVDSNGAPLDSATRAALAEQQHRPHIGMFEDRSGARWFPFDSGGISRLVGGRWTHFGEAEGVPPKGIRSLYETRDGALWMLTLGGGLLRFQNGRFERLTMEDGLASDFVRGFHEDGDGIIWIGSFGNGLTRLERGASTSLAAAKLRVIRTRDGLADDVVNQILEDDAGRLWLGSNRGIFSVRRADLDSLAAGRVATVQSVRYDEAQGMLSREVNGGGFPSALRARDGRLWFPTQDGLAVIDPSLVLSDTTLGVLIESVTAGDSVLSTSGELRLASGRRDIEISYTAPAFVRAEHLRFRYRLDSWHDDWVEAGTRRSAAFTNLPPGRYTFRVAVTHGDGRWTELAVPLRIVFVPRVHETTAFRVAMMLALALAVAAGAAWRARTAAARARELERLVHARTAELAREKELTARQAESLAALDRAKDRFFANISHEFRTPLTLILGPIGDLEEGRQGALSPVVRGQLAMMRRNAQRLLRLINQVLDLTRLKSGALTLDLTPHDLGAISRALTQTFSPLADRRRIALEFQGPAAPLAVRLDVEQFEKVLLNLLSNALKFTEPGGRVAVRVGADGNRAILTVEDTGIGIPPALLPRVFDRFFQADGSTTRRHEGSGIGLSLAKELVELHGGTIDVKSAEAIGTTFTVRLPLIPALALNAVGVGADDGSRTTLGSVPALNAMLNGHGVLDADTAASAAMLTGDEDDDAPNDDRTTVLVVDDNADVRAYVRSVLAAEYRVLEAEDGESGLAAACEALPDLVLADVMMPRMDGYALARALRADPATDCIPVVLLTARVGSASEVAGLGAGADDYVTKPFDRGVLEARIAGLIATRRRLRDRFRSEGVPAAVGASATPELFALPSPEPTRAPSEVVARLRAIVEASLTDELNPEMLAAAAALSYQQLYRRLREELDVTPSEFIRTVRVERAALLLQAGTGSVTEVAYAVGFNSLSHFSRCFRERFGVAPTALRSARD